MKSAQQSLAAAWPPKAGSSRLHTLLPVASTSRDQACAFVGRGGVGVRSSPSCRSEVGS